MTTSWKIRCWKLGLVSALAVGGVLTQGGDRVFGQNITLDGTLGPAGTLTGPDYVIPQAVGQTVNSNLFHSFGQFSLDTGESAGFQSAANIRNILSRVTGGSASFIDGLIFTQSSNVNLFLINPSGISFGPNASLDVGGVNRGSFVATTVDALMWPNGEQFSATNPGSRDRLLTIVGDPSGFLASLRPPQPILSDNNNLAVSQGQSLLLVGGDVSLDGGLLRAPGGRVELGGVAEPGTVGLNVNGNNLGLTFPASVARADVSLTNSAEVNVAAGGGGSIAINARNVDILEESGLRAGISPLSGSVGAQAGDITLNATGAMSIENSFIYNAVFGAGNGGNLSIDTGQLIIQDGVVATVTLAEGRAGDFTVNASDSVELSGSSSSDGTVSVDIPIFGTFRIPITVPIGLFAASLDVGDIANVPINLPSGGNAGNLTIDTGRLIVQDGAVISAGTASEGQAGNLTVTASDFVELIGTSLNDSLSGNFTNFTIGNRIPSGLRNETSGFGLGGDLTINTGRLIVRDGAWVTSGTAGNSPGGELTVNASDSVELIGTSLANGLPSVLASGSRGAGDATDLTINTGRLIVQDGAIVSAGTSSQGEGGNLTVNALDSVELIGTSTVGLTASILDELIGVSGALVFRVVADEPFPSGLITGTAGTRNAGNLTIETGRLAVRDGAQASVSTVGAGNAGTLTIRASTVELTGTSAARPSSNPLVGPSLLTTAVSRDATGNGGDIQVQANSLFLTNGARLSASTSGQGSSGNIQVNVSDSVNLSGIGLEGLSSGLFTTTEEADGGQGGNITVITDALNISNGAVLSARTENASPGGNITVNANTLEATGGGQMLTTAFSGGDAGNINVNATDSISLSGSDPTFFNRLSQFGQVDSDGPASGLSARSTADGNAGDLTINTRQLQVQDGAQVSAATVSSVGGDIILQSLDSLQVSNGQISASTETGRAGSLNVNANENAAESVELSGQDSGLFAQATAGGDAGSLTINTLTLTVQDGAEATVSSPQGQAGDLTVIADSLLLDRGELTAVTGQGQGEGGANITLQVQDLFQISNESRIAADALGTANGGNINIDTDFLIAQPPTGSSGSDIRANAFQGKGGELNITASGIFGIEFRPNETPFNDITASSELGDAGVVTLNTPDVDPSRGLVNLPTDVVDASGLIAQSCSGGATASEQSEFIITGRGGLPPNPNEPLSGETVLTKWATLESEIENRFSAEETVPSSTRESAPTTIVEAQGWVIDANGEVVLTATAPSVTPNIPWMTSSKCHTP